MAMVWYKEVEDQKEEVVVVGVVSVHCSMDHAIRDTQVGHNHGLVEAAAADGPEGVGTEKMMLVEFGMEVEADDVQSHMGEGPDHRQELVAAQVAADNKVLVDEDLFVYWIFDFGFPLKGSYCYSHLCFYPGNSDRLLVSEHLQSFPCTGCSLSLQSHCSAALHL
jgi:hypothetical protein